MAAEPLAPVVTDGIRKDAAVVVERRAHNRAPHLRVPLQPVLGVLVPEVERAVAPRRAEGAVHRMPVDVVDGKHLARVPVHGILLPVTLEGEVLAGVGLLDVLHRAAPLDGPDGEARRVREAADHARLPLERRGQRPVELRGLGEVDHVDEALGGRDDQQLVPDVHGVYPVLALDRRCGRGGAQVPVLDGAVPAARDEHGAAAMGEGAHALDGLVVRGDLLGGGAVGVQVQHPGPSCRRRSRRPWFRPGGIRFVGGGLRGKHTSDQQTPRAGASKSKRALPSEFPVLSMA